MELEKGFWLGNVRVEPVNGRLVRNEGSVEVEPKVMALLCMLARTPGDAVSRDAIFEALWPGVTVNDDALARAVWKLRQALGDDARNPAFVATVAKKGYRLLVEPAPLQQTSSVPDSPDWRLIGIALLAGALMLALVFAAFMDSTPEAEIDPLITRADEFYYQYTEADNDAAMRLYRQAVEARPGSARALSGLANTITQEVIRWSPGEWEEVGLESRVRTALANGRTQTPTALAALARARQHAEMAVAQDADYALAHRALGLVLSAQGEIELAMRSYDRAATLDPDAWEVFINLSDLHNHQGEPDLALAHMELAFEAMSRVYESQTVLVRPWYSETGLSVADRYHARSDDVMAERWYRRVLQWDPLNVRALTGLAAVLSERGDEAGVREACAPISDPQALADCLNPH